MNKISLIIPAKNEGRCISKVLQEVFTKYSNLIDEVIIIVDSKKDNTIKIAQKYNCKISVQTKSGYGNAIIEGFKQSKAKYGCIFNSDYSFDPIYLAQMIKLSKKYEFIFGSRYKKNGSSDDDTFLTLVGNTIFTFLTKIFLRINLSDVLYTYVLCNVKKFNKLKVQSRDFRFCIELPFLVNLNKYKYCDIAMHERARISGKKKVNEFKDGALILLKIIQCLIKKNANN